jgi:methionyl-tRNA formyltransferase
VRVVFMGTPAFAVPSLEALAAVHDVVLAVTRPDSAAGRGSGLRASAVKDAALDLAIPVMQPHTLAGDATRTIASLAPAVVCVAAFGMLLPPETLAVPTHGCVNVHASLLPRYRGAAPIQRAILNGDVETGVSIMLMEAGLDTGPYALQRRVMIGERTAAEVEHELARVGAEALLDVLGAIEDGSVSWTVQDEAAATYAAKITKDDVALLPTLPVTDALRRVRAQTRSAPARACLGEQELTVVRARPTAASIPSGAVCVVEGDPVLGFSDGAMALDVVRPAGRGDMPGRDWARGARLPADACWRCTR